MRGAVQRTEDHEAIDLVLRLYALLSLGRNLSPLPKPRKNHSLVTSGMYSYVRHPM